MLQWACSGPAFSELSSLPVIRKLQEFELPYVSVTSLRNPDYKILLRKRYGGAQGGKNGEQRSATT